MSTQDVAPVEGQIVRPVDPTHVSQGHSFPAHDFFNVIRKLVKGTTAFSDEADKLAALNVIDEHESHVVPKSDQNAVTSEVDDAPVEDVSQRRPANAAAVVPASSQAPVDYDQLARALVRAQAEQANTPAASEGDTQA